MLVAFLIKSNNLSRVLSIGVPLSGRKAEEGIELIGAHIITELGGVDVVIPASAGSGNSVPELKKAIKQLRSAQHNPDCPAEMSEGFETAIQYIRREWLHQ